MFIKIYDRLLKCQKLWKCRDLYLICLIVINYKLQMLKMSHNELGLKARIHIHKLFQFKNKLFQNSS